MLNPLTQDEGPSFELQAVDTRRRCGPGDEHLVEGRHGAAGDAAELRVVDRDLAPADHGEVLVGRQPLDALAGPGRLVGVGRQEGDPGRVGTRGRERAAGHGPVEGVGDLDQDAGPVAGVDLRSRGTSVFEVAQAAETLADHVVAASPVHVYDERDAAGVVLEFGAVQANGHGR